MSALPPIADIQFPLAVVALAGLASSLGGYVQAVARENRCAGRTPNKTGLSSPPECDDHIPKIDMVLALHGKSPSACRLTFGSSSKFRYRCRNRKRSELPITDTELKLIAAAATIGLSNSPKVG